MNAIRGKRPPPAAVPSDLGFLLWAYRISAFRPARALAAETLTLERTLSDLANQAYALAPAENDLLWKTAPPRMPIPPPAT